VVTGDVTVVVVGVVVDVAVGGTGVVVVVDVGAVVDVVVGAMVVVVVGGVVDVVVGAPVVVVGAVVVVDGVVVVVVVASVITNVRVIGAAAAYVVSPACVAVSEHVPGATGMTVPTPIVQIAVSSDVTATGRPLDAETAMAWAPSPVVMSAGCPNVMFWAVSAGVVKDTIAPKRIPSVSVPAFVVPVSSK
jgi:hypothetical protein